VRGRFADRYMKDRALAFCVRRKVFDHDIIIESHTRCAEALSVGCQDIFPTMIPDSSGDERPTNLKNLQEFPALNDKAALRTV
jgi:hypothetical protein